MHPGQQRRHRVRQPVRGAQERRPGRQDIPGERHRTLLAPQGLPFVTSTGMFQAKLFLFSRFFLGNSMQLTKNVAPLFL